ncbi:MAG: MotA/TolQ/ExbB proton channel family protein [Thermoleophilaceae bacterium]
MSAPLLAVTVEGILFDVAEALRVPVLVLALGAAVIVTLEVGALLVEMRRRRRRGIPRLEQALDATRAGLAKGDRDGAVRAIRGVGFNRSMADALAAIVEQRGRPDAGDRVAKRMAEYDYRSMKRLERTRILVRAGPALGLMGTLIPLSPALEALAAGDVTSLTEELRVAFSVTVAGLLIGMVAFAVSLVRDRLYSQDYSDVEYVAAALGGEPPQVDPNAAAATTPAGSAPQPQPAAPAAAPAPTPAATAVTPAAPGPQGK